jgi:hypothetical protein
MRDDHRLESRAQSERVGARSGGSLASSVLISSSESPTRWAKTMNAIRRNTGRAKRIADDADVRDVIELMRLNYTRIVERHGLPSQPRD